MIHRCFGDRKKSWFPRNRALLDLSIAVSEFDKSMFPPVFVNHFGDFHVVTAVFRDFE